MKYEMGNGEKNRRRNEEDKKKYSSSILRLIFVSLYFPSSAIFGDKFIFLSSFFFLLYTGCSALSSTLSNRRWSNMSYIHSWRFAHSPVGWELKFFFLQINSGNFFFSNNTIIEKTPLCAIN